MSHTPTPWEIYWTDNGRIDGIGPKGGNPIDNNIIETDSGFYNPSEADAEFIVRAVNSHEELLNLLKEIAKFAPFSFEQRTSKAIAKAEKP
jgi:hypothetical protein